MRTLAQIISLTVVGRGLKPRGGLKWLHKMHLLLKKRHPAAPCPHQHPSQKAPEFPVDLVQTPHTISAMCCQWEVISRFLPLPGLCLHCLCLIHRSHLSPAQSCAGRAVGSMTADVFTISVPFRFSDPRPWAVPQELQQRQGSAQRAQTNRITALLHFRAGLATALQQRGCGWKPMSSALGWRCREPWQIITPLFWTSEAQWLCRCTPDAMPEEPAFCSPTNPQHGRN